MSSIKELAIIIPAYKSTYLAQSIESIFNQTNQNFTLYIGDDASPYNLLEIIAPYQKKMNLVYRRFDENLGGENLVEQWKRCINLSHEKWIWLFSDDDLLEPNCVDNFYNELSLFQDAQLFHFNVDVINSNNKKIESSNFPKFLTSVDFFEQRIYYNILSFAVEYIFSRSLYLKENGFESFDMAWCADDATWIKFSENNVIITIDDARVKWRLSEINISSGKSSVEITIRKLRASLSYMKWVNIYFNNIGFNEKTSLKNKIRWIIGSINKGIAFSLFEKIKLSSIIINDLCPNNKNKHLLYFYAVYRFLTVYVKNR